ncbi:MAG TPA: hypothetical protein DCX01_00595 [Bacteroidetes bacterium]|nr:hypothetical protein [Bacteroidota bacterium]
MKKTILILTLLCAATITQAQVGIGTASPDSSSILDLTSTSKGLLAPRMTTSERDAITSPVRGLQIYNTDNRAIETFTGATGGWFTLGRGKGAIASNTAVGVQALHSNTSGNGNTAVGVEVLHSNTQGFLNTATGFQALYSNLRGNNNTANGYRALTSNINADHNTATGFNALFSNTTGDGNTANGYRALYSNTTGKFNTAIGFSALQNAAATAGTYNTVIGYQADVSSGGLTNATAIGNGATVTGSNKVRIGDASVTTITGQVAWSSVSDGRIKENVQEAVPGLSFIAELRPVTYTLNTRKQDVLTMQAMPDSIQEERMLSDDEYLASSSIVRTGFIAQEVEAAAKKVGFDFDGVSTPQNETDLYGIRYAEFVVPLVKATQEQQAIITELKATAEEQQATINGQQAKIDQQKSDYLLLLKRIEALEK